MKRIALIDGDIEAYQAAAVFQDETDWDGDGNASVETDFEGACAYLSRRIADFTMQLNADPVVCISDPLRNWRKSILPSYKANRNPKAKPQMLLELKQWLLSEYQGEQWPFMEADDVMGILQTDPDFQKHNRTCIVSIDKDMQTIPGFLLAPGKDEKPWRVSADHANDFWMRQAVTGDAVDGYSGCPGAGPKAAEEFVGREVTPEARWESVLDLYYLAGLDETDALQQARVARICHASDYDFDDREVIPWTPSVSSICPPR